MKILKFISVYVMLMTLTLMIGVDLFNDLPDWGIALCALFITPGMYVIADKYSKS